MDEFVKDRAGQSLAHVFTLLSLVLPTEPLQIAFRGLHTDDQNLQGTALEYLEGMLAAGDPRSAVAVSRRSAPASTAGRGTARRDSRGPAAIAPLDHAEPRRAEGGRAERATPELERVPIRTNRDDRTGRTPRRRRRRRQHRVTSALGGRLPDEMLSEQVVRLALFSAVGGRALDVWPRHGRFVFRRLR